MARIAQPGIRYYSTDVDMVLHQKVKLIFNEFDSHGYWIYSCLLSEIYRVKGYYLDLSDQDYLTLFATDVVKKPVSLVKTIVSGCVRRGLFEKSLFDVFTILTSDRIQQTYLDATSERRRKGSVIELRKELLLITVPDGAENVVIVSKDAEKSILPRRNEEIPRSNSQSKVKQSKVKESKGEREGEPPAHAPDFLKIIFEKFKDSVAKHFPKEWEKHKKSYDAFVKDYQGREDSLKFKIENKYGGKTQADLEKLEAEFKKKNSEFDIDGHKILNAELKKFREYYAPRGWKLGGGLPITRESCCDVFATWLSRRNQYEKKK
jgi:hypothetical protein